MKYDSKELPIVRGDRIYISAREGIGIEELLAEINRKLYEGYFKAEFKLPYKWRGKL